MPDYMEISNDTPDFFPDEIKNLEHISALKMTSSSDEHLMQCRICHTYYWYRTHSPGGSEDAMHTTTYESITKMGLLGVYMELQEAIQASADYLKQYDNESTKILYDFFLQEHESLQIEATRHFSYIEAHNDLLIWDAFACLNAQASAQEEEFYNRQLRQLEAQALKILIHFLSKHRHPELFRDQLRLLSQHPNAVIASSIIDYTRSL